MFQSSVVLEASGGSNSKHPQGENYLTDWQTSQWGGKVNPSLTMEILQWLIPALTGPAEPCSLSLSTSACKYTLTRELCMMSNRTEKLFESGENLQS